MHRRGCGIIDRSIVPRPTGFHAAPAPTQSAHQTPASQTRDVPSRRRTSPHPIGGGCAVVQIGRPAHQQATAKPVPSPELCAAGVPPPRHRIRTGSQHPVQRSEHSGRSCAQASHRLISEPRVRQPGGISSGGRLATSHCSLHRCCAAATAAGERRLPSSSLGHGRAIDLTSTSSTRSCSTFAASSG